MSFTPKKAGQIAAVLAEKAGGTINILKLVKLVYLADRHSMDLYGHPISDDNWVSMDQGPVPSATYGLITGFVPDVAETWGYWMSDRSNHMVSLNVQSIPRSALDEISDADIAVLERIWADFGQMDRWALVEYTHKHCPEWKDPHGSSIPISELNMFRALGRSQEDALAEANHLNEQRVLNDMFASM